MKQDFLAACGMVCDCGLIESKFKSLNLPNKVLS